MRKMIEMQEIIDVWNIIEKYQIQGWKMERGLILIPEEEYDRVLASNKSPRYIKNLVHNKRGF